MKPCLKIEKRGEGLPFFTQFEGFPVFAGFPKNEGFKKGKSS